MSSEGRPTSATIVGDGPDAEALRQRARNAGLSGVRFAGVLPARLAFAKGRILIVPSRAESLPYIVLEAAAAGLPMIATSVGGIPEIFGPDADKLTPPGDARSLAAVIAAYLRDSEITRDLSLRLQARVRAHFSIEAMSEAVLAAYGAALDRR
jgi:glycosyltransferase involved in cell wall biosynthesis